MSLASATDSKGVIAVGRQTYAPLVSTTAQSSPSYYTEYDIHPIGPDTELTVVFKPVGSDVNDWHELAALSSDTDPTPANFDTVVFHVSSGPASTPVFRVEYVVNVEITLAPASAFQQLAEPQPIYNPQLLVARNEVYNNMDHIIKGAKDKAKAHLKQEAKKALTKHILPFLAKKGAALLA